MGTSSIQRISTIALELVPTPAEGGRRRAEEEAGKVRSLLERTGLAHRINTLLVPQIIAEDGGRPVPLEEKIDAPDFSRAVAHDLPMPRIITQVTAFTPAADLEVRLRRLKAAGAERLVFVGVPRNLGDRPVVGPMPGEAVGRFRELFPSRGVILIPTRPNEEERFSRKLEAGATFALTQLLFSDHVLHFLRGLSRYPYRPEIILSFGYVPRVESEVGLLRWLIRDAAPVVQREMEFVAEVAALRFREKKARLVELYTRILDGASRLGFPIGVHFECPYGVSEPALETFAAMLDASPID